jgi:hypothetical protein
MVKIYPTRITSSVFNDTLPELHRNILAMILASTTGK